MKLGELINHDDVIGCDDPDWSMVEVQQVRDDSRAVQPGDLFVAVEGLTVDGHDFAARAVERGAAAVVAQRSLSLGAPCLLVSDPSRTLALVAARLAGEPGAALELIGVTGTNGKTTTTYLMEAILEAAGRPTGVIGTVAYRFGGRVEPAPFTTPTPLLLQQILRRMVEAGCSHALMEVSSHALELGRVWGCPFAVAAFTHLTQDHLDLHGSMDKYLQAKLLLFTRHLRAGGTAVVNVDGEGAGPVVDAVRARGDVALVTCSSQGRRSDAALSDLSCDMDGTTATVELGGRGVALRSPMLGAFNGDNILLAAACCHAAGVSPETIVAGVAGVTGVPGRLERVDGGRRFAVLVDYAHTPDALVRVQEVLRPICRGRLITVFGCGGDRDRGKRPLMGRAVARGADLALVTSDNPRTEDPLAIIEAVVGGVQGEGLPKIDDLTGRASGYLVEPDRRRAIEAAVLAARDGDIVLIAGKGHEDYQILGTERIHFDDREVAREVLERR
jgi:UDP-N-acetylmuramoyl-L-alanyl-D-glutamate--2,6-diaminopimelate ligase